MGLVCWGVLKCVLNEVKGYAMKSETMVDWFSTLVETLIKPCSGRKLRGIERVRSQTANQGPWLRVHG